MIRYVIPWKATDPGDVTLLRAPLRWLTKLVTPDSVDPAEKPALFAVDACRIDGIDDIPTLLLDRAGRRDTCVIRGVLKSPLDPHSQIRRQLRDHGTIEGRFAEVARSWVMVDLEPAICPVDPTDPCRSAAGSAGNCRCRSRWRARWSS